MQAASPPAVIAPGEDSGVIEVVGSRPDQVQKIDRRTYRVKDNPHAAQSDTLQLLRGLPAVVVSPDDQVMLLGSANLTFLVDERPVQGDAVQYLKTLHGSDIERIEIITNPSAQYSSLGTGGIINIVLRKKRDDGLTGSGNAELSSFGRGQSSATAKVRKGDWTYEVQVQGQLGRGEYATYRKYRAVEIAPGEATINTERGKGSADRASAFLTAKAAYDVDARTSVSASIFGGPMEFRPRNDATFVGLTPDFQSFEERRRSRNTLSLSGLQLTFDRKGKKDGELLKAGANLFGVPDQHSFLRGTFDDGSGYAVTQDDPQYSADANVDWTHPIGTDRILSTGASVNLGRATRDYALETTDETGLPALLLNDRYKTRDSTLAAYTTFQQRIGKWTVMPGLRMERFARTLTSPGQPKVDVRRTSLSPTFHLDRPIGKRVNLTVSYSKRFDRPEPGQLRPYPILLGALAYAYGNPDLRDQSTDAYEVNLHYSHKKLEAGVIFYDRETDDLWDTAYSVDADGNNISIPINAGHRSDRGAQIDISSPLVRRVKGMASVNLYSSRFPLDPSTGASHDSEFRYTINGTIDWQGADRPKRPGSTAQLQLVYFSPSRSYQFRRDGQVSANLSLTRNFSRSLSLTASINGIGSRHTGHRLVAPFVQEDYDRWTRQPEFKLKLSKSIGGRR